MASKFVSAGGAEIKAPEGLSSATDDAWAKARQQVEENKKPKQEAPAPGTQEGGISLYEHLQNQRAAKQEAFEEASKLRNQFRPLDDGEVDFLEGIKQKERLKAATERQETAEQLEAFRRSQVNAESSLGDDLVINAVVSTDTPEDAAVWTATKKRRKVDCSAKPEPAKIRKLSPDSNVQTKSRDSEEPAKVEKAKIDSEKEKAARTANDTTTGKGATAKISGPPKALISYDSDSDD